MENTDEIEFYTLPNGIRVVHIQNDSPVAYCGMGVSIGTRNELDKESGMAHFIEHTLFKGTTHRNSWHILNRLEDVGGDINAYTEKEETFVYATVQAKQYERAMDLTTDLMLHPLFPQKELDKEKDVIIDEINTYNDSPSELIYDDFEGQIFNNQSLGRNVLGDADRLRTYTTADAQAFYDRNYGTNEMLYFSMGPMPLRTLHRLDDKYLRCIPEHRVTPQQTDCGLYHPQHIVQKKDLHQVNYMIGNRAYGMEDKKRFAFNLLNNILGGPGMNSRLNLAIRERQGISYSVESSYTPYTDYGIECIFFSADQKHKQRCIELVYNELKKLREEQLSSLQLHKAQQQMIGQLAISNEMKENLAIGIAKSYLYFGEYSTLEAKTKMIEGITAPQLQEVANEIFDEKMQSELCFE